MTDSHARAARPHPAFGTAEEACGAQRPPCACGDAPMPWTFAHCPWTLTHAPADTLTLSHALVLAHPGSLKIVAVNVDGQEAPVSGPQSHVHWGSPASRSANASRTCAA
jgi:hypothetical protein